MLKNIVIGTVGVGASLLFAKVIKDRKENKKEIIVEEEVVVESEMGYYEQDADDEETEYDFIYDSILSKYNVIIEKMKEYFNIYKNPKLLIHIALVLLALYILAKITPIIIVCLIWAAVIITLIKYIRMIIYS